MSRRRVGRGVLRGLVGRCPACGQGRILRGYIAPEVRCARCGENLSPYQAADFGPYLVTFFIGLVFMPLTLWLTMLGVLTDAAMALMLAGAVALAAVLLPRAKGAAIALLWGLDARN